MKVSEQKIEKLYADNISSVFFDEDLHALVDLESQRTKLLWDWEVEWHMKSHIIWLAIGEMRIQHIYTNSQINGSAKITIFRWSKNSRIKGIGQGGGSIFYRDL